jgi:RNA polymerase-binding transcription factor DksA
MEPDRRTPFSDAELDEFRAIIDAKRAAAQADIDALRAQIRDSQQADNDSTYSVHMADAGTDAAGRESLYQTMARLQTFVGHLDRALARIEHKTYGVCRVTGQPIAKERLRAVPHTETTIEAKRDEQRNR